MVLPLCKEATPANVKSAAILFARDGEKITLVVKITSCGMLARAAFLRDTGKFLFPLREHSGFRGLLALPRDNSQ